MKGCLNVSKGQTTYIPNPEDRKNRLRWNRLRDVLIRRMALKTHNLPSERLKMWLWWWRWSDVSWCRKAIQTHFSHFGHSKKQFVRSHRDDVLSRRMDVRTHNQPTARLKKRMLKSMKRYIKVSKGHRNSFSAFCESRKSSWMKTLKWCLK
jgi:hypothetical protein